MNADQLYYSLSAQISRRLMGESVSGFVPEDESARSTESGHKPIYIREVEAIPEPTVALYTRESLKSLVEAPLVKACQVLYDKGITTGMSSANNKNIENDTGGAIHIVSEALSPDNQEVAERLIAEGKAKYEIDPSRGNDKSLVLVIPLNEDSTVEGVERYSLDLVNQFVDQEKGPQAYTLEEMRQIYNIDPADTRADINYFLQADYIRYDKDTMLFYPDETIFEEAQERKGRMKIASAKEANEI